MDCLHVHKVHELLYLAVCRAGLPAYRHIAVFHTGRLLPAADHKIIILSMFIRKTDIKAEITVDDLLIIDLAHVISSRRNDLRLHRLSRFILDPVGDHGIRVALNSPAI